MADSLSSITGLISGIDYRSLVDQIIAQESRPATLARNRITQIQNQQAAIKTYRGLLEALNTAATALRDGSAFDAMSATTSIVSGSKNLLTASATPSAAPASYNVAVTSLAKAQKLGSAAQTGTTTPLGLTGDFTVNGQTVSLAATDTLADLRDKINALNSGSGATKVSASILSVGTGSHKLILTSQTLGSAGMSLADTSGSALQTLGILSAPSTISAGAVLQAGTDAVFTIDGIGFTRTSNSVSDALEGVTLNLTGEENGAVTRLDVERHTESARQRVQDYVDAYNKVIDFLQAQSTVDSTSGNRPALYGDNMLRTLRGRLPELMLTPVGNAAADLNRPGLAGVSLDKTGHLTFDTSTFNTLFETRLDDLRTLFQQTGTATGTGLGYVGSTIDSKAGTWAVDITQLATQTSVTGAGLNGGVFSDDATPDTMTVTDTRLGTSVSISLADGMTSAQIASALTAAFATGGLGLTAVDNAGQLQLTQSGYGSKAGITVAYTAGGSAGPEPIAAGSYSNGLDVTGTIGGFAATGSGQVLLGDAGSDVAGLAVRYDGAGLGAAGDVTVNLGAGAEIERVLTQFVQSSTGVLANRESSLDATILSLQDRADRIDSRLEGRRDALLKQFAQMESAIASFQNQARSVTAMLGALTQSGGSK